MNSETAKVTPINHKPPQWRKLTQRERRELAVKHAVAEFQGAMVEHIEELQKQHNRLVIEHQAMKRVIMRHLHRHSEIIVPGEPAIIGIHPTELLKAAQDICAELVAQEVAAEASEQAKLKPHAYRVDGDKPESDDVCACGAVRANEVAAPTPCPLVEAVAEEKPDVHA